MNEYLIYIATIFSINVILASSLNIINGYCGLFSLGHAGFYAVGAYSSAAASLYAFPGLVESHPALALIAACVVGMAASSLLGLVVGIPCLRLTGDYLAIATIGFSEIVRILILNMDSVGASRGLPGIPKLTTLLEAAIGAIITLWILRNLIKSSFGRAIISIREDEIAARSMGIDVRFYKTFAFVTGSLFAGLAGALFAHNQQFLHPNNFSFMVTVTVLLMIVIGGIGSQVGAVLGALIVTVLPEALRFSETLSSIRMLVFGLVMIVVMLWQPTGLMGLLRKRESSR